jgi:hypothetical protein
MGCHRRALRFALPSPVVVFANLAQAKTDKIAHAVAALYKPELGAL